jgi:hypothetical protein
MLFYSRRQLPPSPGDLDRLISSVLTSLPAAIDTAIDVQQAAIRFKVFKRQSQGYHLNSLIFDCPTQQKVLLKHIVIFFRIYFLKAGFAKLSYWFGA